MPVQSYSLLSQALARRDQGIRKHTANQYDRQFKLFLAFTLSRRIIHMDSVSTLLLFLEFLASNALTYRVVMNYMSALKSMFGKYGWSPLAFESPLVKRMLKGINYTVHNQPTPRGLFTLQQIREISRLCEIYESSLTYRAAFLLAFYGLLRISNIAPPFAKAFDPAKHLLRQDVTFLYPGTHIALKWAKNLQAPERTHRVKLPRVRDPMLCPTQTLHHLLTKRALKPSDPLFILDDYSLLSQSHLRRRLATLVRSLGLPITGFGFHTFRRSGATLAYDSNISLTAIKMHGVWNSDAVWSYISDNTSQSLQVPLAFQTLANALP